MKKSLAALAAVAALALPVATAGSANAATPNYHHKVTVTASQYIYWDRNWPLANRSISLASYGSGKFSSKSAYPGATSSFFVSTDPDDIYGLNGVHERSTINSKEIKNSGGRISVHFANDLAYGGNCDGCWYNHQAADFTINRNGTAYYTLINDHGDGSWGETDIVVKNIVTG